MSIITRERELAQERALSGALALARLAGWQIDQSLSVLPKPFRNYLYVAKAELLLVPSIETSRGDLDVVGCGMREARSDALVVKASSMGRRTLYCAVGEWQRDSNLWHHVRRLWLSPASEAWLVPDPADPDESKAAFRLTGGRLRGAGAPPVYDRGGPSAGLDRADALLAATWGDR